MYYKLLWHNTYTPCNYFICYAIQKQNWKSATVLFLFRTDLSTDLQINKMLLKSRLKMPKQLQIKMMFSSISQVRKARFPSDTRTFLQRKWMKDFCSRNLKTSISVGWFLTMRQALLQAKWLKRIFDVDTFWIDITIKNKLQKIKQQTFV